MDTKIKSIIRAARERHPNTDVHELAHCIMQDTPRDDLEPFIREQLVGAVRAVINSERREQKTPAERRQPPPSPKLEQRRSWWQDMLATTIVITQGNTKVLADCTVDDLELAAKDRDTAIERLEGQRANFRTLINLMARHGAHTVAQLPEQRKWVR